MAHAQLTEGQTYTNRGGGSFRCLHNYGESALMVNIKTGWTLRAHNVHIYEDGTIEWDFSTDGYWGNNNRRR